MRLSKKYTTVTPLSKFLAMALFIALPFIAFYLGTSYQKSISVNTGSSLIGAEETANWETKQVEIFANWGNEKFEKTGILTFKLPSGWQKTMMAEGVFYRYFNPKIAEVFFDLDAAVYYSSEPVITCDQLAQEEYKPSNKKFIKVDEHRAIYQETHTTLSLHICDVFKKNGTYAVSMGYISNNKQLEINRIFFNQILSTFKFTQ